MSLITIDQAEVILAEVSKKTQCPKCKEIVSVKSREAQLICDTCGHVIIETPGEKPKPGDKEEGSVLDILAGEPSKAGSKPADDLDFVDVSAADSHDDLAPALEGEAELGPGDIIYAKIAKNRSFLRNEDLQAAIQDLLAMRQRGKKRDLSTVLLRQGFITFHQAEEVLAEYNRVTLRCANCGWVTRRSDERPGTQIQCGSCDTPITVEEIEEIHSRAEDRLEKDEKEASWVVLAEPEFGEKFIGKNIGGVEITKYVGKDKMGRIYAGKMHGGKREVAVRIISPAVSGTPSDAERLVQSLHEMVKVHHFNIPRIYDADVNKSGRVYLIADLFEGTSIFNLVSDRGPLPPELAYGQIKAAADALSTSHGAGVYHRNLSPLEFIETEDRLLVNGFGIVNDKDTANILNRPRPQIHPHFLSPEAADGLPSDARSDMFSLGACMYFMLTAKTPFAGSETGEVLLAIKDGKYTVPDVHNPGAPNSAVSIIKKAMAPNPDDRYQTAQEFLADIKRAEAGDIIETPVFTSVEKAGDAAESEVTISPRGAGFWLGIIIALLIAGGALFYILELSPRYLGQVSIDFDAESQASRVLQEAKTSWSENKKDVKGARRAFQEILERYPNTKVAVDAADYLNRLPKVKTEKPDAERDKILAAIHEAEGAGDLLEALESLWKVKKQFDGTPKSKEWQETRKRLDAALQTKQKLRYIPAGEFLSGRGRERKSTDAFLIDTTEVTCAKYAEFCRQTGHKVPRNWTNNNFPPGQASFSVSHVTRADAEAYAAWAKKSLPTETEWEKAARGTDGRDYPWGKTFKPGFASVATERPGEFGEAEKFTQGASPYGCLNMAGNVAEWTASNVDGKAVVRGGSFRSRQRAARTWARAIVEADAAGDCIGFRCVTRLP
jgi:serine/threonine protein kinase/phage FluMu protein Com